MTRTSGLRTASAALAVLALTGCATECTGPKCVDQMGWWSQCYGRIPQAEEVRPATFHTNGKTNLVNVRTTHELVVQHTGTNPNSEAGWLYAERLLRATGQCEAGFERVLSKYHGREFAAVGEQCWNLIYSFRCLSSETGK